MDVIKLLAENLDGELSEDELRNYAAAGHPLEQIKNLFKKKD